MICTTSIKDILCTIHISVNLKKKCFFFLYNCFLNVLNVGDDTIIIRT